jgi:hypothetical protein
LILGKFARKGKWMKTIIAVLALCTFATGALAAGTDCRTIESNSVRLSCYDAASPPKFAKSKEAEKRAGKAVENDGLRPDSKDMFQAEDARTNAKLKNICRGC